MNRREALAAIGALVVAACGGAKPQPAAPAPEPPRAPLHTTPLTDIIAAAGLVWLVDARLREIFATPDLLPALDLVLPAARLDKFAKAHGGVDLRQIPELVVASYPETMLYAATGVFDPARMEREFKERADPLDGRAIDDGVSPDGKRFEAIARLWGTVRGAREQLAVFGRSVAVLEHGRFGPLKAAEAFAQGKLKRAKPALVAEPLARAAELLGDAPFRGFAPGPFEDEWANALGGLLRASTALAFAARVASAASAGSHVRIDCTLMLTGAWGEKAPAAAERLASAVDQIAKDPLGKLLGLDRPLAPARVRAGDEIIAIDVGLDALELARGVRAATEASMTEIMSY
jgi:hypothetical protein